MLAGRTLHRLASSQGIVHNQPSRMIVSDLSVRKRWVLAVIPALLFLFGTIVMLPHGSLHTRLNVPPFLGGAVAMLTGFYLALLRTRIPLLIIGFTAVAARLLLLFQQPGDDIYRYLWEGKLLLNHVNPYLYAPDAASVISFRDAIWTSVQHKTFSAIYPPLAEWAFALLALVPPGVILAKIVFAAADLLTGALLWMRYGGQAALFYYGTLSSSMPSPEADTTTASLFSLSCLAGSPGRKACPPRQSFGLAWRWP